MEKLKEEIASANKSIPVEKITEATWFNRELNGFENFNAERNHNQGFKIYLFADWLIRAYFKHEKQTSLKSALDNPQKTSGERKPTNLSDKQIYSFALKLSQHPEFASKFSEPGESYEKLAARIAVRLEDPTQAKKWESYLIKNVKFKMGLISQIVELNVKQSITLTNIARSEALFWGFEQEDLKDLSEVLARRSAVVAGSEQKLLEAKAKMKEGKRAAFQRKLEIIEAGESEEDEFPPKDSGLH